MIILNHIFGKYYPIVIDIETTGVTPEKNAILEIAYTPLELNSEGKLVKGVSETFHVLPFDGAEFCKESMEIHKIDPFHPFRFAEDEKTILEKLNSIILSRAKNAGYRRAILVGHNAWFDLAFINNAYQRHKMKSPFHQFTSLDTATLAGFHLRETVLARALYLARIDYSPKEAHSALYDAEKTAELICFLWNKYHSKK